MLSLIPYTRLTVINLKHIVYIVCLLQRNKYNYLNTSIISDTFTIVGKNNVIRVQQLYLNENTNCWF